MYFIIIKRILTLIYNYSILKKIIIYFLLYKFKILSTYSILILIFSLINLELLKTMFNIIKY